MLNQYLIKNDKKIAYRVIDGETIIINLDKSTFHILDPVASLIWNEANGNNKIEQIIKKVNQEFETDLNTVEKDCIDFINDLLSNELTFLSTTPKREEIKW